MSNTKLLTEGGLYGHLSHLYDFSAKVPPLTFNQLTDIFNKVSQVEVQVGEKLDGQTMFITFVPHETDADKGAIVLSLARKADVLTAPEAVRDPEAAAGSLPSTIKRFAGRNEELKNAFIDSLTALDTGIKGLDLETQKSIFGPDEEGDYNWFAFEIMDPGNPNVINYDKYGAILALHVEGHGTFSSKNREKKVNLTPSEEKDGREVIVPADPVRLFKQAFEKINKTLEDKSRFKVISNEFANLKNKFDATPYISQLQEQIQSLSALGLTKDSNVADYVLARILATYGKQITDAFREEDTSNISEEVKLEPVVSNYMSNLDKDVYSKHKGNIDALIETIMDQKGRKTKVTAGLTPEQKNKALAIYDKNLAIKKEAMAPLESIIHNFAVQVLDKYESAYILSNGESASELQKAVSADIEQIQAAFSDPDSPLYGDVKKQAKFEKEKEKITDITTSAEGVTFLYDGRFYKLTGNFAPINQILGMKPGRFLREQEELTEDQAETYVFIPGGFKPPHADHWKLLEEPLGKYPDAKFTIIIGKGDRDGVTSEMSKEIWEVMIADKGVSADVRVIISPVPVRYVYEQASEASPGSTVVAVYGSARGADGRFARLKKYVADDVEVEEVGVVTTPADEGGASGTQLRKLISKGPEAKEEFLGYMPDLSDSAKDKIWNLVSKKDSLSETALDELIEGVLAEVDLDSVFDELVQSFDVIKAKMSDLKSSIKDAAPEQEEEPEEEDEEEQPILDAEPEAGELPAPQAPKYAKIGADSELEEMSSMAGGNVAGFAAPLSRRKRKMKTQESKLRKVVAHKVANRIDSIISEQVNNTNKARKAIRAIITEVKQEVNQKNQLREVIQDIFKEVILEQEMDMSEKEMFNLVRKEIAGVLKATIKILQEQAAGDPEQVQVGHLKATIIAINNLFDQVEAAAGNLEKLELSEQLQNEARLEVEIGDIEDDVASKPEFMSLDAMDNGGVEKEDDEIDIGDEDHDDVEKATVDLNDDDIQTLFDKIKESDPENASYQILGARRALDDKTGSWPRVKKIFLNYAERIIEADLPPEAWNTFRKWVVENVRLHLINTIQETAKGETTDGEEDLTMSDLSDPLEEN